MNTKSPMYGSFSHNIPSLAGWTRIANVVKSRMKGEENRRYTIPHLLSIPSKSQTTTSQNFDMYFGICTRLYLYLYLVFYIPNNGSTKRTNVVLQTMCLYGIIPRITSVLRAPTPRLTRLHRVSNRRIEPVPPHSSLFPSKPR